MPTVDYEDKVHLARVRLVSNGFSLFQCKNYLMERDGKWTDDRDLHGQVIVSLKQLAMSCRPELIIQQNRCKTE